MAIEYLGLSEVNGPLVVLEGVKNASYEEIVEFTVDGNEKKLGRIVAVYEDKAVIQVFEGTSSMSLTNTHTRLTGHPMEIGLSEEILGRTFDGIGKPIDRMGPIDAEVRRNVNGLPLNPVTRKYPRNYIHTGISAIDGLTTLIRGQKLPIFSGNGLPHDQLAAQIVQQASLGDSDEKFAIVFAAMGVKYDVAEFFRRTFEESGVSDHVVMFLNLANDPVVERLITPKVALTAAEYLAFEKGMHILVILTDITSFCEAMREVSSSRGEIPSRKGYPGYLYSELATLYERAGIVQGVEGSVTQIPILTMPNDDITHPIPDLTGYITEGQIVLDRQLHGQSIYPPISVLPARQHSPAEIRKQMKLIVKTTSTEQGGVFHSLHIFKYSVGCNGDPVIQLVGLWILAPGRKHKYFVPRRNRKDRLSMEKNLQPPVLFAKGFNLLLSETPG